MASVLSTPRSLAANNFHLITVQRITVLFNARAGSQDPSAAEPLATALRAAGCDAEIRVCDGSSVAAAAADALTGGSQVIVAAGGDGTVSTAASAVVGTGAVLGVIPLGTLNHFARDIGVPLDLGEAAQVIAAGRTTSIDVGDVNGRPFLNNSSIGMYARLVTERAAMQRLGSGKWVAHGLAAMRVWRRYRRLRVEVRRAKVEVGSGVGSEVDRRILTPFVFVGNNEYQLSGLEFGGRKTLAAGRLHVCMAPGMSRGGVARMIIAAIFGDVRNLDGFESFTASAVELDAGVARLQTSIDGEVVTLDHPLTYRIRSRALRVIVP
jgi:diacylglycerol kinase family enzyme